VTEAGFGENGRIKSAVDIGALLDGGLGDTVRVSLTEDPEAEGGQLAGLVNNAARLAGNDPQIEQGGRLAASYRMSRQHQAEHSAP
jgi:(E)-4-hydroxy-3-methylbut-2-enyl-diphosphate synthase